MRRRSSEEEQQQQRQTSDERTTARADLAVAVAVTPVRVVATLRAHRSWLLLSLSPSCFPSPGPARPSSPCHRHLNVFDLATCLLPAAARTLDLVTTVDNEPGRHSKPHRVATQPSTAVFQTLSAFRSAPWYVSPSFPVTLLFPHPPPNMVTPPNQCQLPGPCPSEPRS